MSITVSAAPAPADPDLRTPLGESAALPGARVHRVFGARTALATGGLSAALVAGVAGIIVAYSMARRSTSSAHFSVFWVGFALVLVVVAVAGVRTRRRASAFALLSVYGVVTFIPKFLMSRNGPVFFDEFGHVRHANDIIATGHLAVPSSYLPIIKFYPGLEVLTAWLHNVTGLSAWHAGQIIVLVSHGAVLLLVWALARAAGLSEGPAFIAALVYSLNPSFMYFDTQYAYESLGIPLCFAATAMSLAATRSRRNRTAVAWCLGATAAAGACIVTHHISAVFAVLLLLMVACAPAGPGRRATLPIARWGPTVVALAAATGLGLWITFVSPGTIDYVGPHLRGGLRGVVELVTGHSTNSTHASARHQLFAGSGAPFYEKVCAYLAPAIAGLAVVSAVAQAWKSRRERARVALVAPFIVLAGLYFLSLPLALTLDGGETAHRAWAYGYLGIAVCAGFSAPMWRRAWLGRRSWARAVPGLLALLVLAVGNVAAGENVFYRFPGPYVFGSDTRSQTPELHQLATWVRTHLPVNAKVVTDRFTGEVITAETRLVVPSPSESRAYGLYREGDGASPSLRAFLATQQFRYWILDTRIESHLPAGKFFQGYIGPASISVSALATSGQSAFLTTVHRTSHYVVMEIAP